MDGPRHYALDVYDNTKPYFKIYGIDCDQFERISIEAAMLSVRSYNALKHSAVNTIKDLLIQSPSSILGIRNLGKKSFEEINDYILSLSHDDLGSLKNTSTPNQAIENNPNTICKAALSHREDIALGNFEWENAISDAEKKNVLVYKNAYEIIGPEFVLDCVVTPERIIPIWQALSNFVHENEIQNERMYRLKETLSLLPEGRANKLASYYISAYTLDEFKASMLLSLCKDKESSLADLIDETTVKTELSYYEVQKLLSWACFDINNEISELFKKIYDKERTKLVIQMRARRNTLEEIGRLLGVTRERVRQIELKARKYFVHWANRNRILHQISAERNGDLVLTESELAEYFGVYTLELIYLFKNFNTPAFTYDEQINSFVLGDDTLADRVQQAVDDLPDIFSANKYSQVIAEVCDENNAPEELVERTIQETYTQTGDTFHRCRLSLAKIYNIILDKYYQTGLHIYDDFELAQFRDHVRTEFGNVKLPDNNRALSARLSSIGMLCGRGMYKAKSSQSIKPNLAKKIYNYICQNPSNVIMTNTIFYVFEEELLASGIDNKYYLQGILRELYEDKFFFKRDYVCKDADATTISIEVIKYIKRAKSLVSLKELKSVFIGVPDVTIAMSVADPEIINYFGTYLHRDNLKIYPSEVKGLKQLLDRVICDRSGHHIKELFEELKYENPDLIARIGINNIPFRLYSVLENLFRDQYKFSRPYVASLGVTIGRAGERLKDLVLASSSITIDEIREFSKENHYQISQMQSFINSFNETHLFVNENTLVSIDEIGITEMDAKQIEQLILDEIDETVAIVQLKCICKFNRINYPWTEWLIYSILLKWSNRLDVDTTSPVLKDAIPIVAPKGKLSINGICNANDLQNIKIAQVDDLENIDDLIADIIFDEDLL